MRFFREKKNSVAKEKKIVNSKNLWQFWVGEIALLKNDRKQAWNGYRKYRVREREQLKLAIFFGNTQTIKPRPFQELHSSKIAKASQAALKHCPS